MHAEVGDWLLVGSHSEHHTARRAHIEEVHGEGGSPPYLVRWTDDDHHGLVFPGPDSRVLSPAELAEHDAEEERRIAALQKDLLTGGH